MITVQDVEFQKFKTKSQEILKNEAFCHSSSPKLDVRIIRPNSNSILGGWKYSIGNYNILFPSLDSKQAATLMKKHIRAVEPIINYESNDDADMCELGVVIYSSTIYHSSLETIQKNFRIPYDFMMVETFTDDNDHLPWKKVSQSTGSNLKQA